jgi:acetyl-CoA acetyltransferase
MKAIMLATQSIKLKERDVIIAGGLSKKNNLRYGEHVKCSMYYY